MDYEILKKIHLRRCRWMRARLKLEQQADAFCRSLCDGDKDAGEKLLAAAKKAYAGKGEVDADVARVLEPYFSGMKPFKKLEAKAEKAIVKIVEEHPIAEVVKTWTGFGMLNLGSIIAETGDLDNYSSFSKLRMRMGLGCINGERQRLREGDSQGYSKRRRTVMYKLADCLIKKGERNPWHDVYYGKKEMIQERDPDASKMRHHLYASRALSLAALRELYRTWTAEDDSRLVDAESVLRVSSAAVQEAA